jgi:2-succinyl-6-hydroxy-2,4-cyclohexadiene-1-carboxylate synthase
MPSTSCILLHGFANTPTAWDDVVAAWPLDQPPIAIALPGHNTPIAATWDDNVALIARTIAVHPDAILVGYSMGARLALGLVAAGRARRAILIGVHPGLADPGERAARRTADAAWSALLRDRPIAAFASAWEAQPIFATATRAPADRRARRRAARLALDPETLADAMDRLGLAAMPDLRSQIAGRARDLALITGADDAKFTAIAGELVAATPGLHHATIADSGHDPTLEQPVALAAALANAVKRLTAS